MSKSGDNLGKSSDVKGHVINKDGMMGLKLDNIEFSVSGVNKDRRKCSDTGNHVTNEGTENIYKDLSQKEITGEVSVSAEEIEIPEIKKEKNLVDEKIGQKRVNKEELSRGRLITLLADA
ncbi:hypothetical protein RhiirC2_824504 [Rhizophagus irregularis]|uniref:Uncharacterized protein n=1 Tax=Rhizophagus irregularis TaxID=588596 RepID=A0A2N1P458_9GLOM|nr:hypothetical protein RhiirC2_824504 [Rhizophagus irregularis]